jgi:hypothetical protein
VILGVACEDEGHFSAVSCLVDAALLARHDWLRDIIEHCRSWRGLDESRRWYKYEKNDARDLRPIDVGGLRIKLHGRIKGESLQPEASMWRTVLLLFCRCEPRPDVVLLVRDMDGRSHRTLGMEQVREGFEWPFVVAIAAPQPEIEAWHVSGFEPATKAEHEMLGELQRRLSFDPILESHRLTSRPNDAVTDAKLVLEALCSGDQDRRQRCIADLDLLRRRGTANGASAFLEEVEERVLPVFVPGPR